MALLSCDQEAHTKVPKSTLHQENLFPIIYTKNVLFVSKWKAFITDCENGSKFISTGLKWSGHSHTVHMFVSKEESMQLCGIV